MNMPEMNSNRLQVKQQEINRIELRSEEVMDILGSVPHWSIHSGSFYLLGLVLLTIAVTWFIKYPDVIAAPVVITTERPPLSVVSPRSGYIKLMIKDNEQVRKGQLLGYLSSTADVKEVVALKNELDSLNGYFLKKNSFLAEYVPVQHMNLGELQEVYNNFLEATGAYQLSYQQQGFKQQIHSLQQQIASYSLLMEQTKEKNAVMFQELQLSDKRFVRDSLLFVNKVLAHSDFEEKRQLHLQSLRDYKNAGMSITTYVIQRTQLESKVAELLQQEQKQNKDYLVAIEASIKKLDQAIRLWMEAHVLNSPIDGYVALFNYWADHQYVKADEEILSVIPGTGKFFGMAKAPLSGSGQIKTGQMVYIKLDNFPSAEHGMLEGSVETISMLPRENNYLIRIKFSDSLHTTYGKTIEPKQEMVGQAEIITKDVRLLERFFFQIRKVAGD
jgi:multidrug resistance efflux pump